MAITALPPDTDADIARVTEALAMITPRWNVRILLALSGPPQRYSELAAKVSWLQSGQLHPKLKSLCDAGLVERTEHTARPRGYRPIGDPALAVGPYRNVTMCDGPPQVRAHQACHGEQAGRPTALRDGEMARPRY